MVVLNRRELGRQRMNSLLRGERSRQRLRRGRPRDDIETTESSTASRDVQTSRKGVTLYSTTWCIL